MRPLVILRPEPGASATAGAAKALGLEPIVLPLFEIEPIAWTAPDPVEFDGLLLTSANAVRHGGAELHKLRGLAVHAVGEASAAEARWAGFVVATIGEGGVDELLQRLDPGLRLLHLCGEQHREPAAPRQAIFHLPAYRAAEREVAGIERIAGAVVVAHSPRAAARIAQLAAASSVDISGTSLAAISAEAALAAGSGWQSVAIADEPRDSALLALAARLCQNPG